MTKEKNKKEIIKAMRKLWVSDVVNSGRTVKEIAKKVGLSESYTRSLLQEMGEEGITDYIREYNLWLFQRMPKAKTKLKKVV